MSETKILLSIKKHKYITMMATGGLHSR
jgi:hypothetical protein